MYSVFACEKDSVRYLLVTMTLWELEKLFSSSFCSLLECTFLLQTVMVQGQGEKSHLVKNAVERVVKGGKMGAGICLF